MAKALLLYAFRRFILKLATRDITEIALFVALMVVGAFVKIPNPFFPMVPITLQLFFAILAGLVLGARNGLFSQIIYLALGLVGLPVFAYGGGIGYVLNPSFGFVLGFVLAAYLAGLLREKIGNGLKGIYLASILGFFCIYALGIPYIYLIKKLVLYVEASFVGICVAMVPFMIKDLVLVALNGVLVPVFLRVKRESV